MKNNSYSKRPGSGSAHFSGHKRRTSNSKPKFRGAFIHHSKFINQAVAKEAEKPYVATNSFSNFPLNHILQNNIASKGYKTPSAIQDQAILPALEGKDVIGLANTGTGKTAAFVIPVIERIQYAPKAPSALILAPTRELATQIDDEFRAFAKNMRLYSAVCVGGVNIGRQVYALQRRPHLVIGTPGRIKDLIKQRKLDLRSIDIFVLDEADRMLDMGFLPDIRSIAEQLPAKRQTLCFSATITPTIKSLIDSMMHQPVTVSVRTSETSDHVEQNVIEASSKDQKIELLTGLLKNETFEKVLVFGETKFGVQRLADTLTKHGYSSEAIHGNKSQPQRQRALNRFKSNEVKVLVATDVAARGLDIPNVSHVINFDQPHSYDDYIHRIGRTGRAGNKGHALTFIEPRS